MSNLNFKDDEPIVCDWCHNSIVAGETYLKLGNNVFCGETCLGNHLINRCEYEKHRLYTKGDYEDRYADIICDERRGK